METHQDRDIAQGLRKGEAGAFHALFEAYFERVWRSVARLVGRNSADVADVVQETFVAAAKQGRTYDPARGSLWLWLGGIARNHAGTFHRDRHRRNRVAAGGDLHVAVGKHLAQWFDGRVKDPPEQLMSAETAALVRAVLAELPSD